MVISSVPFDQKFLARVAASLGTLTIYTKAVNVHEASTVNGVKITRIDIKTGSDKTAAAKGAPGKEATKTEETKTKDRDTTQFITAGSVGAQRFSLDREFNFGGLVQTRNWADGANDPSFNKFLTGTTRLSTIYSLSHRFHGCLDRCGGDHSHGRLHHLCPGGSDCIADRGHA